MGYQIEVVPQPDNSGKLLLMHELMGNIAILTPVPKEPSVDGESTGDAAGYIMEVNPATPALRSVEVTRSVLKLSTAIARARYLAHLMEDQDFA